MRSGTAASPAQPAAFVALEFHQLDLRYEGLRICRRDQERRLLGSVAERGQQVPILVVGLSEPGRFAVIDGHKRVRALAADGARQPRGERGAGGIARHRLTTRDVGELWAAWRAGPGAPRERLLADPLLFLKTRREVESEPPAPAAPAAELLKDVDLIGGIARRARRRLAAAGAELGAAQREELARATEQALLDLGCLRHQLQRREEEQKNADTRPTHRDSGAAREAGGHPPDRAGGR